ncbi:hypothetical protein XU18_2668 [Perkinsela sp. CCAP 1560/4]|nr:hypothetical protein XU18_4658 [Perkinsela sp. CCAP 1560/4]KNH06464.1 hypothetical protein XU18_2668 [Perkinsela sp. CCAP 1560/4]|eukprot:KNH03988.1 hypothetical protein XU18_4658 [Perkinsela sp. CCAP 1560/4]
MNDVLRHSEVLQFPWKDCQVHSLRHPTGCHVELPEFTWKPSCLDSTKFFPVYSCGNFVLSVVGCESPKVYPRLSRRCPRRSPLHTGHPSQSQMLFPFRLTINSPVALG